MTSTESTGKGGEEQPKAQSLKSKEKAGARVLGKGYKILVSLDAGDTSAANGDLVPTLSMSDKNSGGNSAGKKRHYL